MTLLFKLILVLLTYSQYCENLSYGTNFKSTVDVFDVIGPLWMYKMVLSCNYSCNVKGFGISKIGINYNVYLQYQGLPHLWPLF